MENSIKLRDSIADECGSYQMNPLSIILSEHSGINIERMKFENQLCTSSNVPTPLLVESNALKYRVKANHSESFCRPKFTNKFNGEKHRSTCRNNVNTSFNTFDIQANCSFTQYLYDKTCFRKRLRKLKKFGGQKNIGVITKIDSILKETDLTSSSKSLAFPVALKDNSQSKVLNLGYNSQIVSNKSSELLSSIMRNSGKLELSPTVSMENTLESMIVAMQSETLISLLNPEGKYDLEKEIYKLGLIASAVTSRISSNMFLDL